MLFMGEEYGETTPFHYFVDHQDPKLIEAIRAGRKQEFASGMAEKDPPDPKAPETFQASKLAWDKRNEGAHAELFDWYRQLLSLRKSHPALQARDRNNVHIRVLDERAITISWKSESGHRLLAVLNIGPNDTMYKPLPHHYGMRIVLSSDVTEPAPDLSDRLFKILPQSVIVYTN